MDGQASNIIWMSLEGDDLLVRVVVEDPKLEVIRARDKPVLARDEAYASYGNLSDLKRLDEGPCVMVVDVDGSVVETGKQPWLRRVEVDALYTV